MFVERYCDIDSSFVCRGRGFQDDPRSMLKLLREIKKHRQRARFVKEDEFSYENTKFVVPVGHPSVKGHPSR